MVYFFYKVIYRSIILKGYAIIKNHNTKSTNVFNSIGDYYSPDTLTNITFVRDPEKLLVQYSNLIKSVFKKYNKYWTSLEDKKELYSYIVDTFIRLVYEYDINSGVDFPGYVKRLLETRVVHSYSLPEKEKRQRFSIVKSAEFTISDMLETQQTQGYANMACINPNRKEGSTGIPPKITQFISLEEQDHSLDELIEELNSYNAVTEVQRKLMLVLTNISTDTEYACNLVAQYYNMSPAYVANELNQLKLSLLKLNENSKEPELI